MRVQTAALLLVPVWLNSGCAVMAVADLAAGAVMAVGEAALNGGSTVVTGMRALTNVAKREPDAGTPPASSSKPSPAPASLPPAAPAVVRTAPPASPPAPEQAAQASVPEAIPSVDAETAAATPVVLSAPVQLDVAPAIAPPPVQ